MEYKKKSCFVLLSTLLFTFLLGLCGNSYATEFSANDLKNIIYNSLTNFGTKDVSNVKNMCDTIDLSTVSNKTYEYDYVYIILPIRNSDSVLNSNWYMWVFYSNYLGSSKPTPTSCFGLEYVSINFNGYNPDFHWANFQRETRITQNGWDMSYWRFNDQDVYQFGDGTGNLILSSGWHPSNIDDGIFFDYQWDYTLPSGVGNQTVTINGDSTNQSYLTQWAQYQADFGSFTDSSLIGNIEYRWASWNGHGYNYKNWIRWYTYTEGNPIWNWAPGTTTDNSNGTHTTHFYLDTVGQANNILQLKIQAKNSFEQAFDLEPIIVNFLITNSNSRIVSGVFYPIRTFSGDYEIIYNNQENTNDIISSSNENTEQLQDTLTDDSQVEGMLGDLTSGDTNTVAGNFGFSPIDNPFVATIRNVAEGVTDVLLGSGNATVTIGWHDYSYTLRSQDFTLPSNAVVTLIHLICNGFFIWGIYKYGFKLYQWINSGRLQNLVNEANDHQYFWF